MLKQRVITAIVLLAVLLAALLAPSAWPLVILLAVAAVCALWEWLRLTWTRRPSPIPLVVAVLLGIIMCSAAAQWAPLPPVQSGLELFHRGGGWLTMGMAAVWIVGITLLVVQGETGRAPGSLVLSVFGLLAVWTAWVSLTQLYLAYGAWFLVSFLALIWLADIAAYFCGKAFGKHKLAPRVSPGKTWEGALGGVVAAAIWVCASAFWEGSFGHVLSQRWHLALVFIIAAGLAAVSIVGDLFESLLKRRANVKDSSQLLPGHGGVYDRIDALLPTAPLALLLTAAAASS